MAIEMIMPKVDMDQETGTVVEWLKKEGEEVKEGEIILVIETDKVAVDVEAPGSGMLGGVCAEPGDVIPIGTVIAYILSEGEQLPQGQEPAVEVVQEAPAPSFEESSDQPAATPVARNMAAAHGLDLKAVIPSAKGQKITKADVEAVLKNQSVLGGDGKVYAVPAARRVACENQVDLVSLQGSGPGGRIQTSDVLAFMEQREQMDVQAETLRDEPETIPLIGMRRTIAERMTANYQEIPHIRFTSRVLMSKLTEARSRLNALAEKSGGQKISVTAMLVKIVAATLARHPLLNSSLREDEIVLHPAINIGVAVAVENGLIVPVVKNADQKGLAEIAEEVNDLATRAREGSLVNADVKGGTFTISNLGPFGIEQFDAIINAPEAAILALGATQLEAIPDEDGQIKACPIMRMTLSADHRIVDGAVAAHFVADLKAAMEEPILIAY